MLKSLKKEREVKQKKRNKYKEYVLWDSVKNCGTQNVVDNVIETLSDDKFALYRLSYLDPCGVDIGTDNSNMEDMTQLLNSLEHKQKICFPNEQKNLLDGSIEFYKTQMEKEENKHLKKVYEQRIKVMEIFNEEKYVSMLLWVHEKDVEVFEKMAQEFMYYERLKDDELLGVLYEANNELE